MSKEKRRVPKLRFPGFTEDWEQRKLRDLLEQPITDGPHETPELYDSGIPFISVDAIVDNKIDFTKMRGYISKEYDDICAKKYKPQINDVYLVKSGATIGKVAIVDTHDDFNIWSPLAAMRCGNITNPYFLYTLLQTQDLQSQVFNKASHGTQPNLSMRQLEKFTCKVSKIEEQKLISQFLKHLDNVITLHQRKLEHLNLKKKALLQKLFPKNGERYPELRFPGFTDAWEQRKLTDIAKTFIGLVTTMTENYRDSGTLLIRNSDIKEGQFIFSEKPIHLDEEFAEKNKTRRLQIGDVVTVHTGDIGTSAVIQEKEAGAIGFATINTRTDKRILNPYFLSTYFNTEKHKCYANSVSTGDGRSNYNIKDFNKLVISIPTLDEQEKISVLINNINTIITLHQSKLEHLQLQKKALLQQMFV